MSGPDVERGLVQRAIELRPRLVAEQQATEQRTYYSEEMHEEFLAAGFYQLYVPKRYGGLELGVPSYVRLVQEVARGCVSTAWCMGLAMNHALMAHRNLQLRDMWYGEIARSALGEPRIPLGI